MFELALILDITYPLKIMFILAFKLVKEFQQEVLAILMLASGKHLYMILKMVIIMFVLG
tara:strand:- start:1171 stop:1347 length:177 start_codon:yes stop_codon:yes gene_type:complete